MIQNKAGSLGLAWELNPECNEFFPKKKKKKKKKRNTVYFQYNTRIYSQFLMEVASPSWIYSSKRVEISCFFLKASHTSHPQPKTTSLDCVRAKEVNFKSLEPYFTGLTRTDALDLINDAEPIHRPRMRVLVSLLQNDLDIGSASELCGPIAKQLVVDGSLLDLRGKLVSSLSDVAKGMISVDHLPSRVKIDGVPLDRESEVY